MEISRLIGCVICMFALVATMANQTSSQEKEKRKFPVPGIVRLKADGESGDDIKFENKTFLVISKWGGTLTVDGALLKEADYAKYFKDFDDPAKAIVLQIRNEKETSVATAFSTIQKVLMSLPPNFKGKVYLYSKAF
jgi:hypothetical protein